MNRSCFICTVSPVHYVRTKGGFWPLCVSCAALLEGAGLTVADKPPAAAEPFSRPECIYQLCPYPDRCQKSCEVMG